MMRGAQAVVMARWSSTCEYATLTPSGFGPSARISAPRINRSRSSPGWVLGPALTVNLHRCRTFVDPGRFTVSRAGSGSQPSQRRRRCDAAIDLTVEHGERGIIVTIAMSIRAVADRERQTKGQDRQERSNYVDTKDQVGQERRSEEHTSEL